MINIQLEIFLGNVSFVILFLIMVLYWVQAIFFIIPKFDLVIFLMTLSANLSLLFLLIFRWFNYNHFPLSNLYESLLFLSWSFTLIQLILGPSIFSGSKVTSKHYVPGVLPDYFATKRSLPSAKRRARGASSLMRAWKATTYKVPLKTIFTSSSTMIGTIISPIALFTNSFATFSLPKTMQKAQALVPALQSNWLMMHVTVMMLSYTALLCGSLLAITFLIVTWYQSKNFGTSYLKPPASKTRTNSVSLQDQPKSLSPATLLQSGQVQATYKLAFTNLKSELPAQPIVLLPKNTLAKTLDNLSYRILGIGFPLLTIGILSGSVWANEAWGSYWSWDPKETWAFITWLLFAIYLHARITKGWEGEKPALLASFGFFVVWICYLGVNLLGTGLHSYGWMQ